MSAMLTPTTCSVGQVGTTCAESKFMITTNDATGTPLESGGEHFFVLIRGPDKVRAKVTDNGDGTYGVVWKTHTSGAYKVTISLMGTALPSSPWELFVFHPHPHAPNCEVRSTDRHLSSIHSHARTMA